MATIAQILSVKWPDAKWSIKEDDYSTLRWHSRDIPKPDESQIRAFSAEIDSAVETGKKTKQREDKIIKNPGDILDAIEILSSAIVQLVDSIDPAVLTKPVDFTDFKKFVKRLDDTKGSGNNNGGGNPGGSGGNSGGNNSGGNPNGGNPNS